MNKLSKIREAAGMTQEELAKLLGVSKQAVNGWEKGSRKIPEGRKDSLAAIFEVDKSDFDEIQVDLDWSVKMPDGNNINTIQFEKFYDEQSQERLMTYANFINDTNNLVLLREKKAQQKEIERRIHKNFEGNDASTVKAHLTNIKRACELYGHFNNIIEKLNNMEVDELGNYYYRLLEFLLAMESAMGIDMSVENEDNGWESRISRSNVSSAEKCFKKALIEHK
jgi:transcriptional regulator with XRE-family HTH domain